MRRRIKRLPSPALVVSVIALVAALGGTATALKGSNTVGKNDIKKGSVDAKDIAKGAVNFSEIDPDVLKNTKTRWALINEAGVIQFQTGGFTLVNCYQANGNCYIKVAGEDLRGAGLDAEISVANTDGTAIFSGETGTAPCGLTTVNCAPPGAESNDVVVVTPRDSTGAAFGNPPTPNQAARFYVFVTPY